LAKGEGERTSKKGGEKKKENNSEHRDKKEKGGLSVCSGGGKDIFKKWKENLHVGGTVPPRKEGKPLKDGKSLPFPNVGGEKGNPYRVLREKKENDVWGK